MTKTREAKISRATEDRIDRRVAIHEGLARIERDGLTGSAIPRAIEAELGRAGFRIVRCGPASR